MLNYRYFLVRLTAIAFTVGIAGTMWASSHPIAATNEDNLATLEATYCNGASAFTQNTSINAASGVGVNVNEVDNITISWQKATPSTGPSIAFYIVYRYFSSNNTIDRYYARTHDNGGNPATYSLIEDDLAPNTHYWFAVAAFDTNCQFDYEFPASYYGTTTPLATAYGFLKDGGQWNSAFGLPVDTYYTGDFNGDGKGDMMIATTRINGDNNAGTNDLAWYFMRGNGSTFLDGGQWNASFGLASDKYYVADFNGDGKDDIVISTTRINGDNNAGTADLAWYFMRSNGSTFIDGGQLNKSFGLDTDKYYVSDFTGDNKDDMLISTTRINGDGIAGNNDLAWYLMRSNAATFLDGGQINSSFGLDQDKYYVGDFNGDAKADMLISTTRVNADGVGGNNDLAWFLMRSTGATFQDGGGLMTPNSYGFDQDKYFIGDVTGDGKADLTMATLRINGNNTYSWYVAQSTGTALADRGQWRKSYGQNGDNIYMNNFMSSGSVDFAISRQVSTALAWWVLYSRP